MQKCLWCGEPANDEQGPLEAWDDGLYHDDCSYAVEEGALARALRRRVS